MTFIGICRLLPDRRGEAFGVGNADPQQGVVPDRVVTPCAICDGEQGLSGAAVEDDALLVAGAEWAVGLILTGRRHGVSLEKH